MLVCPIPTSGPVSPHRSQTCKHIATDIETYIQANINYVIAKIIMNLT